MALIKFYAESGGGDFDIDMAGSGLGFYGTGTFPASVAVGSWQGATYVTDDTGALEGPLVSNIKWIHASSGNLNNTTDLALTSIANANATMNIRFTHTSAVQIQNAELRIYDRNNIAVGASGVTTRAAELLHVNPSNGPTGSGDTTWSSPSGVNDILSLADSPGFSGLWALDGTGSVRDDTRHDWYVALSARPDSIGSKTQYGMYVSLEYL